MPRNQSASKRLSLSKKVLIAVLSLFLCFAVLILLLFVYIAGYSKHYEPAYKVETYEEAKTAVVKDTPNCRFFDISPYEDDVELCIYVDLTRGFLGGKARGYSVQAYRKAGIETIGNGSVSALSFSAWRAREAGHPDLYDGEYVRLKDRELNGTAIQCYGAYYVDDDGSIYKSGPFKGYELDFLVGCCAYRVEVFRPSAQADDQYASDAALQEALSLAESVTNQ